MGHTAWRFAIKDIRRKRKINIKYDFFRHIQKQIHNTKLKEILYYMLNDENDKEYVGINILKHDDLKMIY